MSTTPLAVVVEEEILCGHENGGRSGVSGGSCTDMLQSPTIVVASVVDGDSGAASERSVTPPMDGEDPLPHSNSSSTTSSPDRAGETLASLLLARSGVEGSVPISGRSTPAESDAGCSAAERTTDMAAAEAMAAVEAVAAAEATAALEAATESQQQQQQQGHMQGDPASTEAGTITATTTATASATVSATIKTGSGADAPAIGEKGAAAANASANANPNNTAAVSKLPKRKFNSIRKGCVISSSYLGQANATGSLRSLSNEDRQEMADRAIGLCGNNENVPVTLSVMGECLEVTSDTHYVLVDSTQRVAFCGLGSKDPHCFVILRGRDGNILCDVFSNAELSAVVVQTLAHAFGASLLQPVNPHDPKASPGSPRRLIPTPPGSPLNPVRNAGGRATPDTISDNQLLGTALYMGWAEVTLPELRIEQASQHAIRAIHRVWHNEGSPRVQLLLDSDGGLQFKDDEKGFILRRYDAPSMRFITKGIKKYSQCVSIVRENAGGKHFCHFFHCTQADAAGAIVDQLTRPANSPRPRLSDGIPAVTFLKQQLQGLDAHSAQALLQHELDSLPDQDREEIMASFRLKKEALTEEEANQFILNALEVYHRDKAHRASTTSAPEQPPGPKKRFSFGTNLKRSLASSFENLLGKKNERGRSMSRSPLTPQREESELSPVDPAPLNINPDVPKKLAGFRERLFRRVVSHQPRETQPRSTNPSPEKMTRNSRRELVRERWQKAVQQQLLLLRMASENERLESSAQDILDSKNARSVQSWEEIFHTIKPKEWSLQEARAAVLASVPYSVRGRVWQHLADREDLPIQVVPYVELLVQPCIYRHAIKIDIDRTFPDHPLFEQKWGAGQVSLFNCMKAYANLDFEVGYCQGLSFVGGLLLMQLNEEDAFRVLLHFMFTLGSRCQYMPDMESLQVQLYQLSRLIHDVCPEVEAHFETHGVEPFLYATPWFLSIFSSQCSVDFALRVFDWALVDGLLVVFKVALSLLSHNAKGLIACESFEDIMGFLRKDLPAYANEHVDTVLADALATDVSPERLGQYAKEFLELRAITSRSQSPSRLGERRHSSVFLSPLSCAVDVADLRNSLRESKRKCHELKQKLDVCTQQVNHAKSALYSLRAEKISCQQQNAALREEVARLSKMLAAYAPDQFPLDLDGFDDSASDSSMTRENNLQ